MKTANRVECFVTYTKFPYALQIKNIINKWFF